MKVRGDDPLALPRPFALRGWEAGCVGAAFWFGSLRGKWGAGVHPNCDALGFSLTLSRTVI